MALTAYSRTNERARVFVRTCKTLVMNECDLTGGVSARRDMFGIQLLVVFAIL